MAGPGIPVHEFVSRILELAATDSAQAWLTVLFDGRADPLHLGVTVSDLAADRELTLGEAHGDGAHLRAAGAAAAVVGSADSLWRGHVDNLRAQLAASFGGDEMTDAVAAQVAWAASDIDAATLQITEPTDDLHTRVWACRQAVARARSAADRLLEHSRCALDASDPVTHRWRDVDAGSRLAVRLLDGLSPPLR